MPRPGNCLFCQSAVEYHSGSGDFGTYTCIRCGPYTLTREVGFQLTASPELYPALKIACRQHYAREGVALRLSTENYLSIAAQYENVSLHAKRGSVLEHIRHHSAHEFGKSVALDYPMDYPLFGCRTVREAQLIAEMLAETKLVKQSGATNQFALTASGWEATDPASGTAVPGTCFVAMAADASLNDAFDLGIRPAIEEDCRPLRCTCVNRSLKNGSINVEILDALRRAEVVIADCTIDRGGVYFEAGYGLALQRAVFFACREDAFDGGRGVHFDTRHYRHVVWRDVSDLRKQLAAMLQVNVPSLLNRR